MGRGNRTRAGLIAALAAMCLSGPTLSSAETAKADLSDPASLPAGLYPALVGAIQADAPAAYAVVRRDAGGAGAGYRAANAAHGLTIGFGADGVALRSNTETGPAWRLGIKLVGYGYGADVHAVPTAEPVAEGNRVEYRYGASTDDNTPALTEWYVNGPLGLEQGFTLARPPPVDGERQGDLVLVLALSGGLEPVVGESGQAIRLTDQEGRAVLRYGGLYAHDAKGRKLPARLALADGGISIRVDDSAAVYPVTIDPLLTRIIHDAA